MERRRPIYDAQKMGNLFLYLIIFNCKLDDSPTLYQPKLSASRMQRRRKTQLTFTARIDWVL